MAKIDREIQKLAEDTKLLRDGIADITLAWANIENAMVILLSKTLMNDPGASMASTLYFSGNSLEGRLRMVDAACRFLAERSTEKKETIRIWHKIYNKISRLKGTRNAVAHGQIITASRNGKNQARLASPMFDFNYYVASSAKRQFAGMSANDIQESIVAARGLHKLIMNFMPTIQHIVSGDNEALRETLAQLEDQFQTISGIQDNQSQ